MLRINFQQLSEQCPDVWWQTLWQAVGVAAGGEAALDHLGGGAEVGCRALQQKPEHQA